MNDGITLEKKSPWVTAAPYIILIAFWATTPMYITTRFWLNIFILVFVRTIGSVSLRTLGLSGNMSFAHAAFMGLGAYVAGTLGRWAHVPAFITIPAAALVALVIGVLTGLPFVRLRSMYFCMASMFLGVAIMYIITAGGDLTGGANGLSKIPSLFRNVKSNYYFFFALCLVSCAIMYRFEFSRIGTTLRALSQSPAVAASIGISEKFYRLLAVGIGCFFAGLAGGAYAHYNTVLSPNSFGMGMALWFIMYMMIGGQDKFLGPIIGTAVLVIIPEYFRSWSVYSPYATAVVLIIVAYFLPGGLVSIPSVIKKAIVKARSRSEEKAMTGNLSSGGGNNAA
jgi:branched-chain amino acid transport system permease protein